MAIKRFGAGLAALLFLACGALPAPALAQSGINSKQAVCDPAYPNRCLKPDANGAISLAGGISVNSAAKATAAAPTYVEGTSNPLSMDLSGHLRTDATGGGGGGASAKATAGAPTYSEGATVDLSVNLTGDLRSISKQSGTWNIGDVTTVGTVSTPVGIKGSDGSTILSASNPVPVNDAGGSITVDGTINAVQSGTWNVNNLSGTVSLPTGASTSALQTTGNASLATIATNTGAATPAGSAIIGKVGIDQTTPGTTNLVSAGQNGTWNVTNVSGTVSLPTGASTAALQTTGNTSLSTIATNTTGLATATAQTTGNGYLATVAAAAADTTPATVNITQVAGSSIATGSGTATGAQRVEIANNGTGTVGLNTGANTIGAVNQAGSWSFTCSSGCTGASGVAQGSTTSGQLGNLTQTATTTSPPTYTTATTNPFNTTTAGGLRTDESSIAGTTTATGNGTTNAGTQRVTLSSDSTGIVGLASGSAIVGKVGIDQTTDGTTNKVYGNVAQIGGNAVSAGNGASGTGVLRVTVANDSTGQIKLTDGTSTAEVIAASSQAATTDTSLVVAQSPNANTLCTSSVAISQITSTDILTTTNKAHICSIVLVSDTAQFINVIEGTGTVCATGGAALIGSTTAGSGLSAAANGGFSAVSDRAWLKSKTTADHICVTQSGSGRLSGVITYIDQP